MVLDRSTKFSSALALLFFTLCLGVSAVSLSCATKPSDMRTLVPAETLVYLETNDLAAALQPIVDAKPFKEVAKSQPDLSALKGVQLAVAVLGFEATEEKLTDEQSVGSVKPRFVAFADTHAWNSTAVAFAEKKLGGFVADIYGSEPKLEKSDKHGGKYFAWTAEDKRKAFALVIDSIVYFANDETAIDKCIAVRRGEADSILKNEKIKPSEPGTLARGYVSTDGIAQISNVVGMKLASEASDEEETRSAIAGIVPKLTRALVVDASWTMKASERGIEDSYTVAFPSDVAKILNETVVSGESTEPSVDQLVSGVEQYISGSAESFTRYNFRDPRLAWRTVLQIAQQQTDPISGKIIAEVADLATESYGISDPELFLASIRDRFVTVKLDDDSEDGVIIAGIANYDDLKKAASKDIVFENSTPSIEAEEFYKSGDDDLAFAKQKGSLVLGAKNSVDDCLRAAYSGLFGKTIYAQKLTVTSPITTVGRDSKIVREVVALLTNDGTSESKTSSIYVTDTHFTKSGMERRTVSDFGLIGQIIAQLADD